MSKFVATSPHIVSETCAVGRLDCIRTARLYGFNTGIICPPAVCPIYRGGVPVLIGGAFGPRNIKAIVGQRISSPRDGTVGNVSSVGSADLVAIRNLNVMNIVNIGCHVFGTLTGGNVDIFLISRTSSRGSASVNIHGTSTSLTYRILGRRFTGRVRVKRVSPVRTRGGLTAITVMNRGVGRAPNVTKGLFNALKHGNVGIVTYTRNTSRAGVSFMISDGSLHGSLGIVRSSFFLSRCRMLGLFVYNVKAMNNDLVRRVRDRHRGLVRRGNLRLGMINVTSTGGTVFDHRNFSLKHFHRRLRRGKGSDSLRALHGRVVNVGVFGSIFISYATDTNITSLCGSLLLRGISMITTGGVTTSSRCRGCHRLGRVTHRHNIGCLFRAGMNTKLPVVGAVGSLVRDNSGVLGVRTILDNALGCVFGGVDTSVPFDGAVGVTRRRHCSRPSPHVSLDKGSIVHGLIVLTHRTNCYLRRDSIRGGLFIPSSFFRNSLSSF